MLLNFCDPHLRSEIKCSTISTEGHEVTNLISEPCKGFLAYSCIRPPVHIDITFLCNVWINHIIIWPTVGSQKSSGFQLYSKSTDSDVVPYTLLSTGFLGPSDDGLLFHSAHVDPKEISVPKTFLKRCIRSSRQNLTAYIHSVRLTICKTENSVPALGNLEIWGTVSPRCGKDVVASVYALLSNYQAASPLPSPEHKINIRDSASTQEEKHKKQKDIAISRLEIPESFLDSITWELMTQPITLPSGNVIDQTTLEKHGQNEAIWGRPLSDPFTGIPFSEHRKPVMATALKYRIDEFLLRNGDSEEIKNIPRVLGHNSTSAIVGDRRIIEIPKCVLSENSVKRTAKDAKLHAREQTTTGDTLERLQQPKRYCHRLPAVVTGPKQSTAKITARSKEVKEISNSFKPLYKKSYSDNKNDESETLAANTDNSLDNSKEFPLPNIKRFNAPEKVELHNMSGYCKCCNNNILYRLPCKHVICRKVLLSVKDNRCNSCGFVYKVSEIERVHGVIF
ncbi:RING finger protein [Ooceraea biroi]|uniref:RING finger protein n=1 Tax=Ooceraea biroi TaxID=2015173 RepID=A0A026W5T5_OOCBI|nr:RING finger protein [Ooceraea biroi]